MFYREIDSLSAIILTNGPRSLLRATADQIFHHFPFSNSRKAIMFLTILARVLPKLAEGDLKDLTRPLFALLAQCAASGNDALAEMAVRIWTMPALQTALYWDATTICPIAVAHFGDPHAHPAIEQLVSHLMRIDGTTYTTAVRERAAQAYRLAFRWICVARTVGDADGKLSVSGKIREIQEHFGTAEFARNVSGARQWSHPILSAGITVRGSPSVA
jgi:hypothetical protein